MNKQIPGARGEHCPGYERQIYHTDDGRAKQPECPLIAKQLDKLTCTLITIHMKNSVLCYTQERFQRKINQGK
jgi:hypothetical protein